ncbi:hypothetical protein MMC24_007266 [Lignoscripta atroalba]|nr:hypothetical protein [Lignoscripta atroalba]
MRPGRLALLLAFTSPTIADSCLFNTTPDVSPIAVSTNGTIFPIITNHRGGSSGGGGGGGHGAKGGAKAGGGAAAAVENGGSSMTNARSRTWSILNAGLATAILYHTDVLPLMLLAAPGYAHAL